ncbi:MAG: bifunctional adenosylcobinamide kinase/adenosylcobinamide-phosphate guanylyltransferase, partial [Actinomycetota bacterium]|nr:bifunctional adenosylcobinamide kinase/adenosylcobinamide-phosphate guanylyltransferase [Actinomycetota bacterium]
LDTVRDVVSGPGGGADPPPGTSWTVHRRRARTAAGATVEPLDGAGWSLTGTDGTRLLWLWGPPAAHPPYDPPYDIVLLGAGCEVDTAAHHLAELRRRGAVTDRTQVVLVDLSHAHPRAPELTRRAARWGARVLPDGAEVPGPSGTTHRPRRTLVLGGARSGKSYEAERRLLADPAVTYVATAGTRDGDAEWAARVATHRERRPSSWRTVETTDVAAVLRDARTPVLVDCLSLWLTAVMDREGAWDGTESEGVRRAVADLVDAWRHVRVPVVAVSNEVGSGVVPATPSGRRFRDELGRLNALVAAESDEVLLTVAGRVLPL